MLFINCRNCLWLKKGGDSKSTHRSRFSVELPITNFYFYFNIWKSKLKKKTTLKKVWFKSWHCFNLTMKKQLIKVSIKMTDNSWSFKVWCFFRPANFFIFFSRSQPKNYKFDIDLLINFLIVFTLMISQVVKKFLQSFSFVQRTKTEISRRAFFYTIFPPKITQDHFNG